MQADNKREAVTRQIRSVACLGAVVNVVLAIVKLRSYEATLSIARNETTPAHWEILVGALLSIDPGPVQHIENVINADPAIRQWHRLRTCTVGREVFLDVHILVDPQLNITVPIEPDPPAFRKQPPGPSSGLSRRPLEGCR